MTTQWRIKGALIVALAAVVIITRPWSPEHQLDLYTIVPPIWLMTNLLWTPRGTLLVRTGAMVAAVGAMLVPPFRPVAIVIALVFWPLAMLALMIIGQRIAATGQGGATDTDADASGAQATLAAIATATAVGAFFYRLLTAEQVDQSAALFVGIPTVLTIVAIYAGRPKSAVGVAAKAVTVGLLISLLFLGEGGVCVLMAAPLFYAVAIALAASFDQLKTARRESTRLRSFALIAVVVPMALEGVTDVTSFNREEVVVVSRVVHATPDAVKRALYQAPRFDRARPSALQRGFPSPTVTTIDEQRRWIVRMRGGETHLNGTEPREGNLELELDAAAPGMMHWRVVGDGSHMTHFLMWRESLVQWEPAGADTLVTWTLTYRRSLDPAWYFGPIERYAVSLAASYLIDAAATP